MPDVCYDRTYRAIAQRRSAVCIIVDAPHYRLLIELVPEFSLSISLDGYNANAVYSRYCI